MATAPHAASDVDVVSPLSGQLLASLRHGRMRLYYSENYVAGRHEFDTTRKAGWVAASLATEPLEGVNLESPVALTPAQALSVHSSEYVAAVRDGRPRALAQSQGFQWDRALWSMVAASNGGLVAAARAAMVDGSSGSLSSGMHHARRDRGAGFCTFNGLVIAAREAMELGARSVLILDFDAHGGGGTASLIGNETRIWQGDVSVDGFDSYESTQRLGREYVSKAADYLPTVEQMLSRLADEGPAFGLCLYNAGMDPYEGCAIGGRQGITVAVLERRERLVFEWCRSRNLPVAFALAGGYESTALERELLVSLHRITIREAARVCS